MKIIRSQNELDAVRHSHARLAFVPTMGALHEGHLALVREAMQQSDFVVVSIFVNPTQFASNEDLDTYPRPLDQDIQKLEEIGAHALWLPSVENIYPNGQETDIHITGVSEPLEGEYRPHFFDGVATVVARLFKAVTPDIAFFGEKDFQQLLVIKKMVRKLSLPIKIIGVPTVRDEQGLALSSRNAYLSDDEYQIAIQLNKILKELARGDIDEMRAHEKLLSAGFEKIDYCTLRNADDLTKEGALTRALAAAWIGQTRLIDNVAFIK